MTPQSWCLTAAGAGGTPGFLCREKPPGSQGEKPHEQRGPVLEPRPGGDLWGHGPSTCFQEATGLCPFSGRNRGGLEGGVAGVCFLYVQAGLQQGVGLRTQIPHCQHPPPVPGSWVSGEGVYMPWESGVGDMAPPSTYPAMAWGARTPEPVLCLSTALAESRDRPRPSKFQVPGQAVASAPASAPTWGGCWVLVPRVTRLAFGVGQVQVGAGAGQQARPCGRPRVGNGPSRREAGDKAPAHQGCPSSLRGTQL